ncbi:1-acyl-sn-glycerol-3-phosphate acyltransferase delta [Galemys pyrenaicus]|uniref:1-acyl-sn-glycerol-3-phosphate acyltransferase delta n=1 Tax=Galemys pyrenaicus TaxID=202257 RepID=A0A8J5ZHE0_GALPY|nr:1-acyl-sn-glycerol-3-phosphate acyltransferase delta [Galemys pyrenaicus]
MSERDSEVCTFPVLQGVLSLVLQMQRHLRCLLPPVPSASCGVCSAQAAACGQCACRGGRPVFPRPPVLLPSRRRSVSFVASVIMPCRERERKGVSFASVRDWKGCFKDAPALKSQTPPRSDQQVTSEALRRTLGTGTAKGQEVPNPLCVVFVPELVMLLEWWSGTECIIHTDPQAYPNFGKENAIVVLNHKFEIDFLCGWSLAERFGVLGGSKVLAKKELAYVPIIGWMWYFTEMVFCERRWEQDRATVSRSLLRLRDYPETYFFLIHCEGTRFTEKKHRISMQVAQAKGLPSLKHHLLPRTKGFAITVKSLRNVGKDRLAPPRGLQRPPAAGPDPADAACGALTRRSARRGLHPGAAAVSAAGFSAHPLKHSPCRVVRCVHAIRGGCGGAPSGPAPWAAPGSSAVRGFSFRERKAVVNNENPTLLGVLNGKKYHADLYVRVNPTPEKGHRSGGDAASPRAPLRLGAASEPSMHGVRYPVAVMSLSPRVVLLLLVWRRIPLEEVPEDEDQCSAWLHKLYQQKVSGGGGAGREWPVLKARVPKPSPRTVSATPLCPPAQHTRSRVLGLCVPHVCDLSQLGWGQCVARASTCLFGPACELTYATRTTHTHELCTGPADVLYWLRAGTAPLHFQRPLSRRRQGGQRARPGCWPAPWSGCRRARLGPGPSRACVETDRTGVWGAGRPAAGGPRCPGGTCSDCRAGTPHGPCPGLDFLPSSLPDLEAGRLPRLGEHEGADPGRSGAWHQRRAPRLRPGLSWAFAGWPGAARSPRACRSRSEGAARLWHSPGGPARARSRVWGSGLLCPQDAFQEEYCRTGTFPETPMVPPRRPWALVNWLFWASLLLYPFFRFLVSMISSGSSLTLASFVLVLFVASMGVRWMIGVTEIDKGSAYGDMDSKQTHGD